YIWGTWFLSSKEELDIRDDFEVYDERFLGPSNVNSQIDIYIPIK
ncbi:TPA: GyrI-like domain-containing protein, partial [Clostridioides difficile]|nr:GyrI-like domain-containing protein [Clostridioides difficile]HBG3698920.1 GyrI-like domain-containing protein [Clostridioides difficile]